MLTYKFISKDEFSPLFRAHRDMVFGNNNAITLENFYTDEENLKTKELAAFDSGRFSLYLTAWDEEKLVGWSWGFQKSGEEFYMCNSAVIEEYRRQKIYSQLMSKIVEKVKEAGFKEITSKHHIDNNAVIIPKLKAGFVIHGVEINARFGLMVNLISYMNPKILEVHNRRTGAIK